MSRDALGHVPLYYACERYGEAGGPYGRYGLEAVRLLLESWPGGVPDELLGRCAGDAGHPDVERLVRSYRAGTGAEDRGGGGEAFIEGMDGIEPFSQICDLGDDGCVEDY